MVGTNNVDLFSVLYLFFCGISLGFVFCFVGCYNTINLRLGVVKRLI